MSAPEFKALFDTPTFKHWYFKTLSKSSNGRGVAYESFVHQTRQTSSKFIDNTKVDFILSKERLSSMLGSTAAEEIFSTIRSHNLYEAEGVHYSKASTGQEQILIKDLKFSTLNNTVQKILSQIGGDDSIASKLKDARTAQGIDRGHVFGFGNTLLMRTRDELQKVADYDNSIPKEQLDALEQVMVSLVDILEDYDKRTSDIHDLNTDMFIKYTKTTDNWLIEWQGSKDNSDSGNKVGRLLGRTGASTYTGARGVFTGKATEEVVKNFVQQFIDESISAPGNSKLNLLNQRASPSLKEMIVDKIISTITGTKQEQKVYSGSVRLPKIPTTTVEGSKSANASIKKQKNELKKVISAIRSVKQKTKKVQSSTVNLSSLLVLINSNLQNVISANMGGGTEKGVLNYRTGRFAGSAKVERLSESRAGMITAFYNYQNNPYQTFEPGFAQGTIASRNPRLLLSTSIREIAATKVANQLRAIKI